MTDRELAQAAWDELTKTTVTYAKWKGQGFTVGHWLNAQNYLNQIDVPAPPPQTAFGLSLPARMPEATGPITIVHDTTSLLALLTTAPPGSRVQIRGGTYGAGVASALVLKTNGTPQAPVQIEAYPGEPVVFAQMLKLVGGATRLRGFTVTKNSYETDARFGKAAVPGGGNVNVWIDCPDIDLDFLTISGATMSGLFGMGDRVQVWNSRITGNGTSHDDHGIYWGQGGVGSLVANTLIDGNACFGFQVQYTSGGVIVANDTIAGNGKLFAGSGTVQAADAKNIRYVNIINVDNGEVAFKSYTAGVGNTISHSLSHGNPQGATYGTFDGVVSLLTGDPLLDAAFRPQAGSPAIGAGDPAYTPTVDLNGKTRVTADIGAVAA